jgi:hypothetical protein
MKAGELIGSQHWCAEDGRSYWLGDKRLLDSILRARPLYLYSGSVWTGDGCESALRR